MQQYETLAHCRYECKYHVVFIPKYQKKVLFGHIRKRVGQMLRQLCAQKPGVELIEGHAMEDHVHSAAPPQPKCSYRPSRGGVAVKSRELRVES